MFNYDSFHSNLFHWKSFHSKLLQKFNVRPFEVTKFEVVRLTCLFDDTCLNYAWGVSHTGHGELNLIFAFQFKSMTSKELGLQHTSNFFATILLSGFNFINVLRAACVAPKIVRILSNCQYLFTLLGSTRTKKLLVEHWWNWHLEYDVRKTIFLN